MPDKSSGITCSINKAIIIAVVVVVVVPFSVCVCMFVNYLEFLFLSFCMDVPVFHVVFDMFFCWLFKKFQIFMFYRNS